MSSKRPRGLGQLAGQTASGALSGHAAPGPGSQPVPTSVQPPDTLVDAHCHIFNVLDVPTFAYVMDVAIENPLLRGIAAPLVALFVGIADFLAPSYDDEYQVLVGNQPAALAAIPRRSDNPGEQFVGGFRPFIDRYTKYTTDPAQPRVREGTAPYDDFVDKELFERFLPRFNIDRPRTLLEVGQKMKEAAFDLARAVRRYSGLDETALYIRQFLLDWAPKLSDYRFQLAGLTEDFNAHSDSQLLITPATLDLTHWLPSADPANPPTSVANQVELMRLIALAQPKGRVVHGFVAYDPVSQLFDEAARHRTALDVVVEAIMSKGCIGVKLYPPMGFQAIGNATIPDRDFPGALTRQFPGLGAWLDKALYKLYDFCVAEDVPIMAHCAPTQGPTKEAAARSHPEFWKKLLDMPAYKTLRVNLGHFGGIWDFENPDGSWTSYVITMIQTLRYPNLYADFADFSDILGRTSKQAGNRTQILQNLVALGGGDATVKSHILYGSDWHLLDREPGNAGYPDAMATWMAYFFGPGELPDLFWRNAARYLGLTANTKTLARLQKFYSDNNGHPAVLDPFIV